MPTKPPPPTPSVDDLVAAYAESEEAVLKLTRKLKEHPEGWDGPCLCYTCLSYGD
jgi:hypothetical protein